MPTITIPATVAPNELIQSAWGNSVVSALDELADESASLTTNTFTGNQLVQTGIIRSGNGTSGTQFAALDTSGGNTAYLGLFGSASDINTPGTRTGLVGLVGDSDLRVWAETGSGNVELRSEGGAITLLTGGANERARINSAGILVNKTSSSSSTTGVECLATGRINGTLDTVETNMVLNRTGSAISSGAVYINALLNGTTQWKVIRVGATTESEFNSNNTLHLTSDVGAVSLETGGTERCRANSAGFLVAKTSSSTAVVGAEILSSGAVYSTATTDIENVIVNKGGSAVVSGAVYQQFRLSNTTIGSVTRNAATSAVLYNTTSDSRYKTDLGLEESDGLATVEALPVRRYLRDGAESASVGMFAQDVHAVIPQAVTPGDEENIWQMAYGDENIVGHLLLAVQQLSAKVRELEGAAA